ncbi:MAG: hypothetical protein HWN68_14000 [Desulfobacterales bacterium]|nr:hypothetical protein [Desulfobacterales bacterium]
MISTLLKLAAILIIADGIGSFLLPGSLQSHIWWLDAGRIGRAAVGVFLLLTLYRPFIKKEEKRDDRQNH